MNWREVLGFIIWVISCVLIVVAIIGSMWFIWWGMHKLLSAPLDNSYRCRGIAEARGSENWASSGWRNDTCYIYLDGEEVRVEL